MREIIRVLTYGGSSALLPLLVVVMQLAYFFEQNIKKHGRINSLYYQLIPLCLVYSILWYIEDRNSFIINGLMITWFRIPLSDFMRMFFVAIIIWVITMNLRLSKFQIVFWIGILSFSVSVAIVVGYLLVRLVAVNEGLPSFMSSSISYSIIYISILSLFLANIKKRLKPSFDRNNKQSPVALLALAGVSFLSNVMLIYFYGDFHIFPPLFPSYVLYLLIATFVLINVFVLVLSRGQEIYYNNLNQLELEVQTFRNQLDNFHKMKESQEKIRAIKHDLKNEHIVLLGLLDKGNTSEAKEYLKKELTEIAQADSHFYTDNLNLNFLLNQKEKDAQKVGAKLNVSVLIPENINIGSDVLSVVIGNLLDNAISAVGRNKEQSDEIKLNIRTVNDNLLLELENQFNTEEIKTRLNRKTEGFGLKNIQRVVEEYDGIYKQWVEGNRFITSIMFSNLP